MNRKTNESALQELSIEWSCQYVSTILNLFGNFCVLPMATEESRPSVLEDRVKDANILCFLRIVIEFTEIFGINIFKVFISRQ
jgi:hypothetical protein